MFFVLFSGKAFPSTASLSKKYYTKLQPLLREQDGFLEETPFGDPLDPDISLLFARFENEDALDRWRSHSTHLRIMHHARHHVFEQFRIIVGRDMPSVVEGSIGEDGDMARLVIVYQRPKTSNADHDAKQPLQLDLETSLEYKMYEGEGCWLYILRPRDEKIAKEAEARLDRITGDRLYRIHVVREYTKGNRKEVPQGLDEAEAKA